MLRAGRAMEMGGPVSPSQYGQNQTCQDGK